MVGLVDDHPELEFSADKISAKLCDQAEKVECRARIPDVSIEYTEHDDSEEGVKAEIAGLIDRVRDGGVDEFVDYLTSGTPCVPVQLLELRLGDKIYELDPEDLIGHLQVLSV